jgi:class 3 adenylate cyclase
VPASAEKPQPRRLTFRLKLLLALTGVILLMAGILSWTLQRETSIQIEKAVDAAVGKARENYRELENTWREQLASLSRRYANSTRILGALDAALEEGDPRVLAEAAEYEIRLAGISGYLLQFADPKGGIVCTLQDGHWDARTMEHDRRIQNAPQAAESFGYVLFRGQLYAAQVESLRLFGRSIGSILIGLPLDEKVVRELGDWVEGHVCFVVDSKAVVSPQGIARSPLLKQMEMAAGVQEARILTDAGRPWALFSEYLNSHMPGEGSKVYAIPLERTLAPFERIRASLILAALATMAAATILGVYLSRGLAAPILELVKGTDQVARGNYDFQVRVSSRDELGVLAKSFNAMVRDLFLKEKYRDLLDKVVSPQIAQEMLKGEVFLGGENRVVTVLFADIRGFSTMTEGMDPREVIAMLNESLEGASATIEGEGGVVDKYIGDEIMAVFGAPVSHPDDPRRAVRAALSMQEVIRGLNASRQDAGKPEIALGIGINTGLAVAGNMGSKSRLNYTVLGETVNLAARLCSMAAAGQILISEATLGAAGPGLDCRAMAPVTLKGSSRPVRVLIVGGMQE